MSGAVTPLAAPPRKGPTAAAEPPGPRCEWPGDPYKRLDFFEERDAPLFSQREREVEEVVNLVEDASTRIVLLHGLSGVGKSSFLRAGLVPLLSKPDRDVRFVLLRKDRGRGEPIFLRSTDDPIGQVYAAIVELAQADDRIPDEMRRLMLGELAAFEGDCDGVDRRVLAGAVTRAIEHLQRRLNGTLLLMIDQAEEVLTLAQPGDPLGRAAAFFAWLEQIVQERLDIRLMVTLRTEYVGQFCACLAARPTRTVTAAVNARAGLEDYLLSPLNDPGQLAEIILRPTLRKPVGDLPPPYEVYSFSFEQGLAEKIARDCLDQARGTSALALIQLVCADLYDAARTRASRKRAPVVITPQDYNGRGVDVALDTFIDGGIRRAILPKDPPHARLDDVEHWRDVLTLLVARDEGGAVRTQMMPHHRLLEAARQFRLAAAPEVLDRLSKHGARLLRRVTLRVASEPGYSLGHDVIAGALARWQESEALRREARRSRRNSRFALLAAGVILAGALATAGAINVALTHHSLQQLNGGAKLPRAEFRLPLLLLAESMDRAMEARLAQPFTRGQRDDARAALVDTLLASPVLGGTFAAVGYDAERRLLVTLTRGDGRQTLRVVEAGAPGQPSRVILNEAWSPPDVPRPAPATGILASAAGHFVALYEDQVLRLWPMDGAPELPATIVAWEGSMDRAVELGQRVAALPATFVTNPSWPPLAEFDNGRLRLTNMVWDHGRLNQIATLRAALRSRSAGPPVLEPVESPNHWLGWEPTGRYGASRMPVVDERCGGRYAFLAGRQQTTADEQIVAYLGSFGDREPSPTWLDDVAINPERRVAWSVALTADCRYMVAREEPGLLRVLPAIEPDPREASLSGGPLRLRVPLPSRFGTVVQGTFPSAPPLLAAAAIRGEDGGTMLRIAWLDPAGLAVVETALAPGYRPELVTTRLLRLELEAAAGWGRLAFSDDGALLFLEQRTSYMGQVIMRAYNLDSGPRRKQLEALTDRQLRDVACRIAGLADERGPLLTDAERLAWLRAADARQPCASAFRRGEDP